MAQAAAERVLIFQTDSLICREGVEAFAAYDYIGCAHHDAPLHFPSGIEAFAAYDYIGAPWSMDDLWCVGKPWLTQVGARLIAPDGLR